MIYSCHNDGKLLHTHTHTHHQIKATLLIMSENNFSSAAAKLLHQILLHVSEAQLHNKNIFLKRAHYPGSEIPTHSCYIIHIKQDLGKYEYEYGYEI